MIKLVGAMYQLKHQDNLLDKFSGTEDRSTEFRASRVNICEWHWNTLDQLSEELNVSRNEVLRRLLNRVLQAKNEREKTETGEIL